MKQMVRVRSLTINGKDFHPSAIQYNRMGLDTDDTFRSADGTMTRDFICSKTTLELKWNYIEINEFNRLLKELENIWFTVGYYDPYVGGWHESTFYCSDRSAAQFNIIDGVIAWTDFSVSFIER